MTIGDGDDDLERAIALSMHEVTCADLNDDATQSSDSIGNRKRAQTSDEDAEYIEVTKKRSSEAVNDGSGTASATNPASDDASKQAEQSAQQNENSSLQDMDVAQPSTAVGAPSFTSSSLSPASQQISMGQMTDAIAQAFAQLQQTSPQTTQVASSMQSSQHPGPLQSLPAAGQLASEQSVPTVVQPAQQPHEGNNAGPQSMLAAQQVAMTAGGTQMLQSLGIDAATASAMAVALGLNQSGPVWASHMTADPDSEAGDLPNGTEHLDTNGRMAASAAASAPSVQTPPSWVQRIQKAAFAVSDQLPSREAISIPSHEAEPIRDALQKAMGLPVRFQGSSYSTPSELTATALEARPIIIPFSASASGYLLTSAALDAAVTARVSGSRLRKSHQTEIVALAAVYQQASALSAVPAPASSAAQALSAAVCRRAVSTLAAGDTDDLYFSEGENAEQYLKALASQQVSPAFLSAMLLHTAADQSSAWSRVLSSAFSALSTWGFASVEALDSALFSLDVLTRAPQLQALLAQSLLHDIDLRDGRQFEMACILRPLLSVGSFPDAHSVLTERLQSPAAKTFTGLRNYPGARGEAEGATASIRVALQRVQRATKEIAMRVIKCKAVAEPKAGQEVMLAWLAAAAGSNFVRTQGGEVRGVLGRRQLAGGSSDRFALGTAALGLQLCRPFLSGDEKHMRHLDPAYYSTAAYRLYTPCKPSMLAVAQKDIPNSNTTAPSRSTQGGSAAAADSAPTDDAGDGEILAEPSWLGYPYLSPCFAKQPQPAAAAAAAVGDGAIAASQTPHFVAECFFITAQLMNTCVLPAVHRYEQMLDLTIRKDKELEGDAVVGGLSREAWLLVDTCNAQLLDPCFAGDAVQFAILQIKWLRRLLRGPDARQNLALVPDNVPKDASSWLAFCVRTGCADLVSGNDVAGLVEGLVELLGCPFIASPLVANKLVALLLTMLSSDETRRGRFSSPATSRALKLAVLGTGAAQEKLLPALMRVYSAADAVVGLDVDRDSFDKFSMRHHIDLLLLELWRDPAQKRALTHLARQVTSSTTASQSSQAEASHSALLVDYARALLNSLMYMLGDSLERLYDVHTIEGAQDDETAWEALPAEERDRKEQFADHQRGLGSSYMRTAVTTLQLLLELVSDDDVMSAFLAPSLVPLAAFASLHFLELLVGPKGTGLKIRDPQKIGFDPMKLSVYMSEFMLHLARSPTFVQAVAAEQDYNESILQAFRDKVVKGEFGHHGHASGLATLMKQVRQIRNREAKDPSGTAVAANGRAGIASLSEAGTSFGQEDADNIDKAYVEELGEEQRREFDSSVPGAYSSLYADLAESLAGDTTAKMRRLQRELRSLAGRMPLPLSASAAIFLRYDSERIDKMRTILTGPGDTPYEGGLFVFDLFFPPQYPAVPPTMKLETTGGGVARFNPNLYADGKVCLSLLGTFSSGDASERWNPTKSSLFQVLVSIQGMILINDPYFNEPSVEQMRSTAEGDSTSAEYNFQVQLNTMRYAMIAHLKRPPPGFEDVVRKHFRLLRSRIMFTASRWLSAAADLPRIDEVSLLRMRSTIVELHDLLATL